VDLQSLAMLLEVAPDAGEDLAAIERLARVRDFEVYRFVTIHGVAWLGWRCYVIRAFYGVDAEYGCRYQATIADLMVKNARTILEDVCKTSCP
jgi:hypothetical protein